MRPVVTLALLLVLVGGLTGCLRSFDEPSQIQVVNVELSPERVHAQEVVLNVTTDLDNSGGGTSGDVRLVAKAYSEETRFRLAMTETRVGALPGDATHTVSQHLTVPREGSVRIEVIMYHEDRGEQRATVQARNLALLEPDVVDTGLRVRDVDFVVQNVTGSRARIETNLYVTNEGNARSEDLRVQVKAREVATRLVADTAWTTTGGIEPGATVIRAVDLTVPDDYNYVFEIVTWRGDVIVARNEGTVQLAPTFEKPEDREVVTTDVDVNDFMRSRGSGRTAYDSYDADSPASGPMGGAAVPAPAALAVFATAALAALTSRRWSR